MEPFIFRQFELGGRFHVPLPKMSPPQMAAMGRRLESVGFRTAGTDPMNGTKAGTRVVVESSGLCTSNHDLSDIVAPALPEILTFERTKVAFKELRNKYFVSEKRGDTLLLRLSPRLETKSFWEELRSKGWCALTPDERLVYSVLLSSLVSLKPFVTDYPVEGSTVRRIGRKQYYYSVLETGQAATTLRGMGYTLQRNAYLPRNSILSLRPAPMPKDALREAFEELGDWCFFSLK